VTELEKALVAFERLDMSLHAAACRLRMAALRDRGQTERAAPAALDWFRSQGIVQPERVSYALVPMRP
jgi:hypothetical protein